MSFRILINRRVEKEYSKLPKANRQKVLEFLVAIENSPFPDNFDIKKIKGADNTFRLRIGDFRLFYKILWNEKVILVTKLERRSRAYR